MTRPRTAVAPSPSACGMHCSTCNDLIDVGVTVEEWHCHPPGTVSEPAAPGARYYLCGQCALRLHGFFLALAKEHDDAV